MVAIPQRGDPTLEMANREAERRSQREARRSPNLGASQIGHACERYLWLTIQPDTPTEEFTSQTLYRFADGHACEAVMAERLAAVEGVTLETIDPTTGRQYGARLLDNRFKCFVDGFVMGLIQAPAAAHIWEGKAVNPDKYKKFQKLKRDLGEKSTLAAWDGVYYAQAVVSMEVFDLTRHYLTVCTPGAREWDSCRTEANPTMARALIARAKRIIEARDMPERASDSPKAPPCLFCRFKDRCHG